MKKTAKKKARAVSEEVERLRQFIESVDKGEPFDAKQVAADVEELLSRMEPSKRGRPKADRAPQEMNAFRVYHTHQERGISLDDAFRIVSREAKIPLGTLRRWYFANREFVQYIHQHLDYIARRRILIDDLVEDLGDQHRVDLYEFSTSQLGEFRAMLRDSPVTQYSEAVSTIRRFFETALLKT